MAVIRKNSEGEKIVIIINLDKETDLKVSFPISFVEGILSDKFDICGTDEVEIIKEEIE